MGNSVYIGPERRGGMVDPTAFAVLQTEVKQLQQDVTAMRTDIKELLALANRSKGALWLGMSLSGGLGAAVAWVAATFGHRGGS